ncbi:hypothetical protein OQ853_23290 [Enterobacter roggenkampii]|nr:hypothetical protein [Enterobacter roggenkampii]MDK4552206.1 hypothetical protein [Enterobacter roggenkampii]
MFDFYPDTTFSRAEAMLHPTPVPAVKDIYFWWFKEIPPGVPIEGCITQDGYTLLYVGISPDKKSNLIAALIFGIASKPTITVTQKVQHSGAHWKFCLWRRTISRSVVLVQARERHLLILASNGWINGWKRMLRFIGSQMKNFGCWKRR